MNRYRDDERDDDQREPGSAMRESVSPEPEDNAQLRAAAARRAAKAALKANPEIAANVTGKSEQIADVEADQSPEPMAEVEATSKRLPWQGDGERIDLNPPADDPRVPDESKWPSHPETGVRVSPKHYARLMQDQREREASERGDIQPSGKVSFLNTVASDEEFLAAKTAFDHADRHFRALEADYDYGSYSQRVQAAITSNDVATITSLKVRRRELPDLIDQARRARALAGRDYSQLEMARDRQAKYEARQAGHAAQAKLRELQAETIAIQHGVTDAEVAYDDSVRKVAAWNLELDKLNEEALTQALGSDAHLRRQSITSASDDDGGPNPYRRMPQPGLPVEQPEQQ